MDGFRPERLRAIRLAHGLGQEDLAARSGAAQNTISEAETGRRTPRPSTLRKFAAALGVEVGDFFEAADSPKVPELFSLEWARTASDAEFYRLIVMAPEEDTDRLDKLLAELSGYSSRPTKRILAERNNRIFEDQRPGAKREEEERLKERFHALRAQVNRRRPPFAWLRSSDDGNECHWFIPPEQRTEEHRERVDKFFGGESYEDVDAWEEAQKKPRGYKEAFLRAA